MISIIIFIAMIYIANYSVMAERWRLEGIPGPSGNYEVGCTHLMHQDLHLRLYYPTEKDLATKIEYAEYLPHPNYLKAFLDIVDVPLSSILPEVQRMHSRKLCHNFLLSV